MRVSVLIYALWFGVAVLAGCSDADVLPAEDTNGSVPQTVIRAAQLPANIKPADLRGHRGIIECLSFSPDGATLATASDREVKLWDTATGQPKSELENAPTYPPSIVYSADGKHIAACGAGGEVALWDSATDEQAWSIRAEGKALAVAFIDGGATVVAGFWNSPRLEVRGFDVRDGKEQFHVGYRGHPRPDSPPDTSATVGVIAFSPDGRRLASASEGTTDLNVRLWDLREGKQIDELGINEPIETLAFSPDGQTLAAGDVGGKLRLWDATGRQMGIIDERDDPVLALAWSADGRCIASSAQRFVDVWDAASRKLIGSVSLELGQMRAIAFSPDSKFIAFSENLNKAYIREAPSMPQIAAKQAPGAGNLPPGGTRTLEGHERMVLSLAFSPDGRTLASSSEDRTVRLWEIESGRLQLTLEGQRGVPVNLAYSPDGKLLASAGADTAGGIAGGVEPPHSIRLWDPATGKSLGFIETQQHSLPGVCFTPDGRSIVAADRDGVVRLFDPSTLKPREGFSLDLRGTKMQSASASPDGRLIAIGAARAPAGELIVCEASSGREVFTTQAKMPIRRIAFSPDSKWLVWVAGEANVHETSGWREVARIEHRYYTQAAAFSPDGGTLATTGGDSVVKLWTVGTWHQRSQLPPPQREDYGCLVYSPDGSLIAVAGGGPIVLWSPK